MLDILAISFGVSCVINLLMFFVAFWRQSDKLTDISYAVSFIVLGVVASLHARNIDRYMLLLTGMVYVWGVRIGGFLLYRVMKKGKDARFDGMREHFWQFGKFWIGQALTVWALMLPVVLASDHAAVTKLSLLTYTGLIVWAIGCILESAADLQKYRFNADSRTKGHWIDEGVWHYSRHPNYFGEILVWLGIYLCAVTALHGWYVFVGFLSPLFITTLLCFVSGIPILEKSADKRWGKDSCYRLYKQSTSLLIPWFKHSV